MILLNFAHPMTSDQQAAIERLTGQSLVRVHQIGTQFDPDLSFREQLDTLLGTVPLTSEEWQTAPILLNLPSLNVIAGMLLAELHGRCGYFPGIVRLRLVPNSTPPRFEVAEMVNLQQIRDAARTRR